MSSLTNERLEIELTLNSQPLAELEQDENWWHVGTISVSKHHKTFTIGFAHPIVAKTKFDAQWFDVKGKQGWAVILQSGGKPPDYFAGWVPSEDEAKVKRWIDTLNQEIQRPLSGRSDHSDKTVADVITFEQGHESAPDSPWGRQRLRLTRDGKLEYERMHRGACAAVRGSVDPTRVTALHAALARTSFPNPPQTMFPPGSTVCVISVEPPARRVDIEYYSGLRVEGYREVLQALNDLNTGIRESDAEKLATWKFVKTSET